MKKVLRNILIIHIIIVALMFFHYKEFSILSYINSSFIIGGSTVFIGLISFIFSTGFFDVFTVTMRKVMTSKRRMEDVMSMRKPSEIFTASVTPLLTSGLIVLVLMGIALIFYYA